MDPCMQFRSSKGLEKIYNFTKTNFSHPLLYF